MNWQVAWNYNSINATEIKSYDGFFCKSGKELQKIEDNIIRANILSHLILTSDLQRLSEKTFWVMIKIIIMHKICYHSEAKCVTDYQFLFLMLLTSWSKILQTCEHPVPKFSQMFCFGGLRRKQFFYFISLFINLHVPLVYPESN